MPISMPPEVVLPPGGLRDLVAALHELYRAAGKPGTRQISIGVRKHNDYPDTVSHEAVGMMLRGTSVVRWSKLESVVRLLTVWSVTDHQDPDAVVRRFHQLWLRASDESSLASRGAGAAPGTAGTSLSFASAPHEPPPAGLPAAGRSTVEQPEPEGGVAHRAGSVSLPERNPAFTGRQSVLDELGQVLSEAAGRPVVLVGQGGLGKTQLVLEYAHRCLDHCDVIWWLPAEQPAHLRAAFRELAAALAVPPRPDVTQTIAAVLDRLETRGERWLLIFDNVDDLDALLPTLPTAGGDVLITTRNPAVADAGRPFPVDVFPRAESVAYLSARDQRLSPAEADRVADRLGDLPLALAQIAALHATTGMPIARYLAVFEGHLQELLAEGRPARYETTLTALVDLAVHRLQTASPVAALLLEVLAHLAPEPIPLVLLRAGRQGTLTAPLARCLTDVDRTRRAVRELARTGLVMLSPDTSRVTLHRVLRECVRASLTAPARHRGRANAHALLAASDPGNPDDARTWQLYGLIAPHVQPAALLEATSDDVRRLVVHHARYLYAVGDYEASRQVAQAAYDRWSPPTAASGSPDLRVVEISRLLANALRMGGQYQAAGELAAQTLDRLRSAVDYGPDHPLSLQTAFGVGNGLRLAGEYAAARALDEDVLERCRRVYGPGHRQTLTAENNLAVSLRLLGEPEAAQRHDLVVKAGREALHGVHDVLVLVSKINLTWDLYGLGRYREMAEQANVAWADVEARLPPGQAVALRTRRVLVVAQKASGQLSGSIADEAHAEHVRRLGQDHEDTLLMALTRVNALRADRRLQVARDLAVEVLDGFHRRFGWRHPLTSAASVTLAAVLRAAGRAEEARRIDDQAWQDLVGLGIAHPFTLCAANGLAADLVLDGSPKAAQGLLEAPVMSARTGLGPDHPVVRMTEANLGAAQWACGNDEGRQLRESATVVLAGRLGQDHPTILHVRETGWFAVDLEPPPA